MATVANNPAGQIVGNALRVSVKDITFSSSYASGGEAISAAQISLGRIFCAIATIKANAGSVVDVYYNGSTGKLQAFTASGEVAAATNLSGLTCEVVFFGADS